MQYITDSVWLAQYYITARRCCRPAGRLIMCIWCHRQHLFSLSILFCCFTTFLFFLLSFASSLITPFQNLFFGIFCTYFPIPYSQSHPLSYSLPHSILCSFFTHVIIPHCLTSLITHLHSQIMYWTRRKKCNHYIHGSFLGFLATRKSCYKEELSAVIDYLIRGQL